MELFIIMTLRKFIKESLFQYLKEQELFNNIWYHGGEKKITKFASTPSVNRRGNVEGFYFTSNIDIAKNYGDEITSVKLKVKKPFFLGKTDVSETMVKTYAQKLREDNDHLPIDSPWIKDKCQNFKERSYMPYTGLDGLSQQIVFKSGGFDCVVDGHEICVFDNDDIIILQN